MKKMALTAATLTILLAAACTALSQNSLEEAAKRTQAFKAKVAKIGVGNKRLIRVETFDGKTTSGNITAINDTSFVITTDNTNATFQYSDVKNLYESKKVGSHAKWIWIGVGSGVGVALILFFHALMSD